MKGSGFILLCLKVRNREDLVLSYEKRRIFVGSTSQAHRSTERICTYPIFHEEKLVNVTLHIFKNQTLKIIYVK
jgi:hypothetical protein